MTKRHEQNKRVKWISVKCEALSDNAETLDSSRIWSRRKLAEVLRCDRESLSKYETMLMIVDDFRNSYTLKNGEITRGRPLTAYQANTLAIVTKLMLEAHQKFKGYDYQAEVLEAIAASAKFLSYEAYLERCDRAISAWIKKS